MIGISVKTVYSFAPPPATTVAPKCKAVTVNNWIGSPKALVLGQQFSEFPSVIGDPCFHRRGDAQGATPIVKPLMCEGKNPGGFINADFRHYLP